MKPDADGAVILWRCPVCGNVEPNSSQSARYCGATAECAVLKRSGLLELTKMERWRYVPYRRGDSNE